jgi:hypothetical protein
MGVTLISHMNEEHRMKKSAKEEHVRIYGHTKGVTGWTKLHN